MYKIEYLPKAKQDISDIAEYIVGTLDNPTAAEHLLNEMEKSISRLKEQPYSCPVHYSEMLLEYEHRKLIVNNYILFYYVGEGDKTVTIARVIYGRRDCQNISF